jgi:hypothetical protein
MSKAWLGKYNLHSLSIKKSQDKSSRPGEVLSRSKMFKGWNGNHYQ